MNYLCSGKMSLTMLRFKLQFTPKKIINASFSPETVEIRVVAADTLLKIFPQDLVASGIIELTIRALNQ